jgi:hypothetical protein
VLGNDKKGGDGQNRMNDKEGKHNTFKVTFWDGKEYAADSVEAVKIVKRQLKARMNKEHHILWTHQYPDGLVLSAAFVCDDYGNSTKASALIEEVKTE